MTAEIGPELREFVTAKFGSPEQLDVFVLLHRDPNRAWTPAQVAASLAMAPESAGMRLFLLASAGLIQGSSGHAPEYRYVAEPALDVFAQRTCEAYDAGREELYALVAEAPRTDPLRQFSDAFKLRKP